jgi:hypothetical protein
VLEAQADQIYASYLESHPTTYIPAFGLSEPTEYYGIATKNKDESTYSIKLTKIEKKYIPTLEELYHSFLDLDPIEERGKEDYQE